MDANDVQLTIAIKEARNLGLFKTFCDKNSTASSCQRLRTIYRRTGDPIKTTQHIFASELNEVLSNTDANRLYGLITAFLKKSDYRKSIEFSVRKSLLQKQSRRCAICGCSIDIHAHVDHIVPFRFVGDELDDNLQMLCADCNWKKNASLDYQIRFFLKLV